jgi:hypothetical protein
MHTAQPDGVASRCLLGSSGEVLGVFSTLLDIMVSLATCFQQHVYRTTNTKDLLQPHAQH